MGIQKKGSKRSHTLDTDVNVTPVMNLFVVLIPFLLFSAVFMRLAVINISLPGTPGEAEVRKTKRNKGDDAQLTVGISRQRLIVSVSGSQNYSEEIFLRGNVHPLRQLHKVLVTVKRAFPLKTDMIVIPARDVRYEMIVNVLDTARELLVIKLKNLFPDVVLGAP